MPKHNWAEHCGLPSNTPIIYATEPEFLYVTPTEIKVGVPGDHAACVLAKAASRQLHLPDGVHPVFGASRCALPMRTDDGWEIRLYHYRPNSLPRKIIDATDSGAIVIPDGGVKLEAFTPRQQEMKRNTDLGTKHKRDYAANPRKKQTPRPLWMRARLSGAVL